MSLVRPKIRSFSELMDRCSQNLRDRNVIFMQSTPKFRELLVLEASEFQLSSEIVKELAKYLNIPFFNPPRKYKHWTPCICEKLICVKYWNPNEPKEYIIMPLSRSPTGGIEVLHHTPAGYDQLEYFNDFVPQLDLDKHYSSFRDALGGEDILLKSSGGLFSKHIGSPANKAHSKLDELALRSIFALIDVHVPCIEGICSKCYNVRFPNSGLGILYQNKSQSGHDLVEVKISPPKLDGWESQKVIYITNKIQVDGQAAYINWNPRTSNDPIFVTDKNDPNAHIPWLYHHQQTIDEWLQEEKRREEIRILNKTVKVNEMKLRICQCA